VVNLVNIIKEEPSVSGVVLSMVAIKDTDQKTVFLEEVRYSLKHLSRNISEDTVTQIVNFISRKDYAFIELLFAIQKSVERISVDESLRKVHFTLNLLSRIELINTEAFCIVMNLNKK
jgi:hypothetical protein